MAKKMKSITITVLIQSIFVIIEWFLSIICGVNAAMMQERERECEVKKVFKLKKLF